MVRLSVRPAEHGFINCAKAKRMSLDGFFIRHWLIPLISVVHPANFGYFIRKTSLIWSVTAQIYQRIDDWVIRRTPPPLPPPAFPKLHIFGFVLFTAFICGLSAAYTKIEVVTHASLLNLKQAIPRVTLFHFKHPNARVALNMTNYAPPRNTNDIRDREIEIKDFNVNTWLWHTIHGSFVQIHPHRTDKVMI